MKIGLSALLALAVMSGAFANDGKVLIKKVYLDTPKTIAMNAKKCLSKEVKLEEHQHGYIDDSGVIWVEKGYSFDTINFVVRKCLDNEECYRGCE